MLLHQARGIGDGGVRRRGGSLASCDHVANGPVRHDDLRLSDGEPSIVRPTRDVAQPEICAQAKHDMPPSMTSIWPVM